MECKISSLRLQRVPMPSTAVLLVNLQATPSSRRVLPPRLARPGADSGNLLGYSFVLRVALSTADTSPSAAIRTNLVTGCLHHCILILLYIALG